MNEILSKLYLGKESSFETKTDKMINLHGAFGKMKEGGFSYNITWNEVSFSPNTKKINTPYFMGRIHEGDHDVSIKGSFRVSTFHLIIVIMVSLGLLILLFIGLIKGRPDGAKIFSLLFVLFQVQVIFDRLKILKSIRNMKNIFHSLISK
ncbi:MAG: hypothetical protein KDC79_17105 [Cyclobacteriaceae bacterium]|nr:hypothetical protein [Cyclobacteriaceae bacterium]